jgi:hypothetical protein
MATIAQATAGVVEVVDSIEQKTLPCAADIVGGTFVRENASGEWVQALATSAANAKGARLALRSAKTGEGLTAMKTGIVGGFTITQAFNVDVFISDTGTVADAAGTASVVIGRVRSATGNQTGAAHDKVLTIDCPL